MKKYFILCLVFFGFSINKTSATLTESTLLQERDEENLSLESPFASMAAQGTDWLMTEGQKSFFFKPISSLGARTSSLIVFPLCTVADILYHTGSQVKENYHLLNTQDEEELSEHEKSLQKHSYALKRCYTGLIATPAGILYPDIVTHHFVPEKVTPNLVQPYGKLYSAYAYQFYPESLEDVRAIIREAISEKKTISVIGSGMSQGKQAVSNADWNVIINTSKLNSITIDPKKKIAKVGAGATWCDLQREANQFGLAVRVMQASNIFSIGGSLSVNCHGWDHQTGSLRNTILSVTLVDGQGKVLKITPNQKLFNYIIGGYGGFGVIIEAEIALTENTEILEVGEEVYPKDYLSYFKDNILTDKSIEMHLYRLSLEPKKLFKTGIAVNYYRFDNNPIISDLLDEPELGTRSDRIKLHTLRRIKWLRHFAWCIEKKSALSKKIATRNLIMRPPINSVVNNSNFDTEWLQEYFVKGEDLAEFLQFLSHILDKNNVSVFNASVRFVKHDPHSQLSYAKEGDRFAVVLFFNQKLNQKAILKTQKWVREVIDYVACHEGSYYLPYQHFATIEQFRACYPNWKKVAQYKKHIDPQGVFENGLYSDYIFATVKPSKFRQVFSRINGQRKEIRAFISNIFMQLNEDKFFNLVDDALENSNVSEEEIYAQIFSQIQQGKPNSISLINRTLHSLSCLKKDLSEQVTTLIGKEEIQGYVEIGYTGRLIRPLKKHLNLRGPFYVINEKEVLTDYIEVGGTRPYDQFINLNDYTPISEKEIPSGSVDLVCCYIGLHHIPEEKIIPWVKSIVRILRPGGKFILMDHDADSEELRNLVDVAHSVFNLGTGILPAENAQEIRNFQSLEHWINLVESQGLDFYPAQPLVRVGDSTRNSLVRFDKPSLNENSPPFLLDSRFERPQVKTYLTAPEWQNVHAAQHYAAFIEKHPAYRYPYLSEISGFWKVFGNSWQAAQKEKGLSEVALSDCTLMNLFIGSSMTLEYGAKGIISAPFALSHRIAEKTLKIDKKSRNLNEAEKESMRSRKEYGAFIEHTPFYQYPYFNDIKSYWKAYGNSLQTDKQKRSFFHAALSPKNGKNFLTGLGMSFEYALKGIVSAPMNWVYTSDNFKEPDTIHLIIEDPKNMIACIDPRITILQTEPTLNLKHLEVPRYMPFKEIMLKMAKEESLRCVSIAGQKKIQIDVKHDQNITFPEIQGLTKLYNIPAPSDHLHSYTACEVEVKELGNAIKTLENHKINIMYLHDF